MRPRCGVRLVKSCSRCGVSNSASHGKDQGYVDTSQTPDWERRGDQRCAPHWSSQMIGGSLIYDARLSSDNACLNCAHSTARTMFPNLRVATPGTSNIDGICSPGNWRKFLRAARPWILARVRCATVLNWPSADTTSHRSISIAICCCPISRLRLAGERDHAENCHGPGSRRLPRADREHAILAHHQLRRSRTPGRSRFRASPNAGSPGARRQVLHHGPKRSHFVRAVVQAYSDYGEDTREKTSSR